MMGFVKEFTRKILDNVLDKKDHKLVSKKALECYKNFTFNILNAAESKFGNTKIESVVFSKDRAMQLHAFLLSYTEMVKKKGKMHILYKATSERHKKSYDQLRETFANEDFVFIEERDFKKQLIEICEHSEAGKFAFYVDDMIFTHEIDYSELGKINALESILALSRGKDFNYSVVLQKPVTQPEFYPAESNLEKFKWNQIKEFSDWTYPLGVSGYMYSRLEILGVFKSITFKAPNSLEAAMQIFFPYFINRYGLCTKFAACVCVHANLVQDEVDNPVLGTYSIEELLNLWENGKRINLQEFYYKPITETQVKEYSFV